MRTVKCMTLIHKAQQILEHKLSHWQQQGWCKASPFYPSKEGAFCVDIQIEQRPVIYTSISSILYPSNDEHQQKAVDAYHSSQLTKLEFIPDAVNNLIKLLEATEARLKVHSNWRYRLYDEPQCMTELFLNNGFQAHHLHPDFFVKLKGRNPTKEHDINFSLSDDAYPNIVLDSQWLNLYPEFQVYLITAENGFSLKDVAHIWTLIENET